MQNDLKAAYPGLKISILGVNEYGHDSANSLITDGRTLPWLQDVDQNGDGRSDVWSNKWDVEWRDVVILNEKNEKIDVYNLTANGLEVTANYNTLRQKLVDAAIAMAPWRNPVNPLDVNGDSNVIPQDVLVLINYINAHPGQSTLPASPETPPPYLDVNGDNFLTPLDPLIIINFLNNNVGAQGEGESAEREAVSPPVSSSASLQVVLAMQFESRSEALASDLRLSAAPLGGTQDQSVKESESIFPAELLTEKAAARSASAPVLSNLADMDELFPSPLGQLEDDLLQLATELTALQRAEI